MWAKIPEPKTCPNPTKTKHVTNHRAISDKTEALTPAVKFSERAIEYIAPDELVEVTSKNIRLRKESLIRVRKEKRKTGLLIFLLSLLLLFIT